MRRFSRAVAVAAQPIRPQGVDGDKKNIGSGRALKQEPSKVGDDGSDEGERQKPEKNLRANARGCISLGHRSGRAVRG